MIVEGAVVDDLFPFAVGCVLKFGSHHAHGGDGVNVGGLHNLKIDSEINLVNTI